MNFVKEFKEFAVQGNALDLAVGVIIAAAFGKIVSSLVENIFMPVINPLIPGGDRRNIQPGPMKVGAFGGAICGFSDCICYRFHGGERNKYDEKEGSRSTFRRAFIN